MLVAAFGNMSRPASIVGLAFGVISDVHASTSSILWLVPRSFAVRCVVALSQFDVCCLIRNRL